MTEQEYMHEMSRAYQNRDQILNYIGILCFMEPVNPHICFKEVDIQFIIIKIL